MIVSYRSSKNWGLLYKVLVLIRQEAGRWRAFRHSLHGRQHWRHIHSEPYVVPRRSHPMSVPMISRTVNSHLLDTSALKVASLHSTTLKDLDHDDKEENFHSRGVFGQMKVLPFTQASVCIRCHGQGLLFAKIKPHVIERPCSITVRIQRYTRQGAPLYIYIEKPFGKSHLTTNTCGIHVSI